VLLLTEGQSGCFHQEVQGRLQDKKMVQTARFSHFMNVFLNLASETSNEELDLNLNLRKEAESFQRLKENRVAVGGELGGLVLFGAGETRQATAGE
jgi:hypothetical protein